MLSTKSLGSSKKVISILALVCIVLLCGCQQREKAIYKVPISEHVVELRQQERANMDSLEKYSALSDTAQVRYYLDLHKAALDSCNTAEQQEVDAFMAEKDREADSADKDIITTQKIILGVLVVVILALLIYISILGMFWTRIGWFFEDIWHWFRRTTDLTFRHYDEDLTDGDIHDIMNIIHHGNPPKYEIRREE